MKRLWQPIIPIIRERIVKDLIGYVKIVKVIYSNLIGLEQLRESIYA